MKVHPQMLMQKGMPIFVVLPYRDYEQMLEALEEISDVEAIKESEQDVSERFPLELVERIAKGGHPIKIFREYRNITQTQLAKSVHISRQYISQIESRDRKGSAKLLKDIAKSLSVDLDDII